MLSPFDVDVDALDAEHTRRSLRTFLVGQSQIDKDRPDKHWNSGAWHILEPATPLRFTWNIEAICEHLDAVRRGEIRDLLITTPPRSLKSTTVAVCWPAHLWLTWPAAKLLTVSHSWDLAVRDCLASKTLIRSEWYARLNRQIDGSPIFRLGDRHHATPELRDLKDTDGWFQNSARGQRYAVGLDGKVTGQGGNILLVDDAHDAEKVESDTQRNRAVNRFRKVLLNRLNSPKEDRKIVIGQRVHASDVPGYCKDCGYDELSIRTEYELDDARRKTSIGWSDPRTDEGQVIDDGRFGPEEVAQAKRDLGEYGYASQHQQRPFPPGGLVFKSEWWNEYDTEIPDEEFSQIITSWDLRFSGEHQGSNTFGTCWAQKGSRFYLIDGFCGRLSILEECNRFVEMRSRHPRCGAHLVEKKADGAALISMVQDKVPGVLAVNPRGDKETRARATTPLHEAGNIWIPSASLAERMGWEWFATWRAEHIAFPKFATNDAVDSTSQALDYLSTATPIVAFDTMAGYRGDQWTA